MKKILTFLTAVMLAAAFAGCSNANNASTPATQATTQAQTAAPATQAETVTPTQAETITTATATAAAELNDEKAKGIAVADAGFTLDQVTFTDVHPDIDDGIAVFEVEFNKDGVEYDYTIDAVSGAILEKESESVNND